MRRRHLVSLATSVALVTGATAALAAAPPAPYANGVEMEQSTLPSDEQLQGITRQASGTNGVPASEGQWFATPGLTDFGGVFSRLGGYSAVFPDGGWTTTVDLWLAPSMSPAGQDLRLDLSNAVNHAVVDANGNPQHRRDFVLHVGTDGDGGFVASTSFNVPGWPANPGRNPAFFTAPAGGGWFTATHTFRNAGGVLAVDISLATPSGTVLGTWTLSDPADVIGQTIGGSRYAWLATNDFPGLHLDDLRRSGVTPGGNGNDDKPKSNNRDGDKHDAPNNRDGDKHDGDAHGNGKRKG